MRLILRGVSVLLLTVAAAAQAQDEEPAPAPEEAEPTVVETTIPVDAASPAVPSGSGSSYPYSWGAARLTQTEYDQGDATTTATGIAGSYLLLPNMYAVGSVVIAETDDADSTETTQFELGGGYRAALTPTMDVNAVVRFIWLETDTAAGPLSDEIGLGFDAGVRTRLASRIEVGAGLAYTRIFNAGHTFATGSAFYDLMPQFSVGLEAQAGNSGYSYGLLGRWAF